MKKILWLASWYPNKLEPLSGDFIERHAKAVSIRNIVTVIFVQKDYNNKTPASKTIEIKKYNSNLTSVTGYYKSSHSLFGSFLSVIRNFLLQKHLIDRYITENGKPHLVNVHISYKAGMGALYCKWRYGIKYIVSEQWTIFCPEARPGFNEQPIIARWLIRLIYKNATHCSAVSEYLASSLSDKFQIKRPVRIPNVVNTDLFHPSEEKYDIFTFIHISVLNYQKSPHEFLEAVRLLKMKTERPFQMIIYGPHIPELIDVAEKNGISNIIDFRGEVMQDALSAELRKCHVQVLYSRFETFGCVVIESFASGVPLVVSDIPVMRELVNENVTGIFVPINDPSALAERMLWIMENDKKFDAQVLRKVAMEKFSYEIVSAEFDELYDEVLNRESSTVNRE